MLPKPRCQPYCPRNQVKNVQIFLFLNFNIVLDGYILMSSIIGECIVECNLKKLQNSGGSVFGATRCCQLRYRNQEEISVLYFIVGSRYQGRCNRSRLSVFLIFNYHTSILFKLFPSNQ